MAKILQPSDLAINGGKPAYTKTWRDGPFHFRSELKELERVLAEPKLPLARGKWVMAYRHALQELYGMKYAIPVSSGTAAVHVGLFAAGVGAGDEVIVSPLTDYGSISGIFQLNAIPVFADVTADSLLMDIASVKQKITRYTRAIMPVHVGGYGVDMSGLMKLARAHKLAVVEDCAQAHLGSIRGKYLGAFGDLGIWSTNESKHIKSGEGGFVLTNNRAKARLADLFADKCYARVPGDPPTPAFPALNVRLSDMNAALAAAQLMRSAINETVAVLGLVAFLLTAKMGLSIIGRPLKKLSLGAEMTATVSSCSLFMRCGILDSRTVKSTERLWFAPLMDSIIW